MERLMIFLDAEYVVQKMKEMCSRRGYLRRRDIRWENIIRWITDKRKLIRCYYYSAEFSKQENPQTYEEQHEYLKGLKNNLNNFEVKLGRLVKMADTWIQKGLDVKIALDMFSKAVSNQYDIAALVSGDSDFAEVILEIKERFGKIVELYTFEGSLHEALILAPDKHILIDGYILSRYNFFSNSLKRKNIR